MGRPTLDKQRSEGPAIRLVGIAIAEPGAIPRHGTPIRANGVVVAQATSGGVSPNLGYGIALAYLPRELTAIGTALELEMRGRAVPARVVSLPFVKAAPTVERKYSKFPIYGGTTMAAETGNGRPFFGRAEAVDARGTGAARIRTGDRSAG